VAGNVNINEKYKKTSAGTENANDERRKESFAYLQEMTGKRGKQREWKTADDIIA